MENLELKASQVVEGFLIGLHRSPFHGFSVEFAEHKIYNAGESTRHVDWKLFARSDRLYTKKYEEETNLRCQIVMDISPSMYFPAEPELSVRKIDFSILCAASIIHLLKKQHDAVGITLYDSKTRIHTPARSSSVHQKHLISLLEATANRQEQSGTTFAAPVLHEIAEKIHQRSLLVLMGDLLEGIHSDQDLDELFSAFRHLKYNKHEMIIFHVADALHEFDFEFPNRPYRFVDMETKQEVKVKPALVREEYKRQMQAYKRRIREKCIQFRIDFVEADIAKGVEQILLPYLVKRSRLY
jgi:uncharacterized protein (DUF58 family)